ncbi:metallophosphoesterase [Prauserella flavalba]|uniref:Metallophosphatase n=1 Tax=Prauserella flavalba TaxID=1477506 RepID=A0A318LWH0_9PSEU|nr:metallophosphoesterase [Prauserella flavalba]PXY36648.1 metallophosphatase [Prauserella flavalba]
MSRPTHTVVQISDTHIVPEGTLLHDKVDTTANLAAAFAAVERIGDDVQAVVLTGDLADKADAPSYRRLRSQVDEFTERAGIPVLYMMGNHDERATFRVGLLGEEPSVEPYDYSRMVGDLRIIVLDSTVPGHHHGELTEEQLAWLADELATPAPAGTVLALHHPPLPSALTIMTDLGLRNADALGEVIGGTDVKLVVSGHAHHPAAGVLAGIPVWISGANAYSQDVLIPSTSIRGVVGAHCTRIDVFAGSAIATSVPIGADDVVYEMDAEQMRAMAEAYAHEG